MEETQVRLIEELFVVCREYCGISWGKALNVVRLPVDSDLRRLESVYYDPEIRELPNPDSSHPEQAPPTSAQPLVDQAPLPPRKLLRNLIKMAAKVRKSRIFKASVRIKAKR